MGKATFLGSVTFVLVLLAAGSAAAATIAVSPADSYQKIESAQAGDEVVLAPGRYAFRVHLTRAGATDQPIVIRAQDPAQPPIWDLGGTPVEDAPGSYTAGDRGRGCWQISGGTYYDISGIVFANCHNAGNNSAGMRYYNGARGIRLRDCVFRGSDNGLTGGTQDSDITVEYCEFDGNGTLAASSSAPSHNLYIYGGQFTLRYSFVHDPVQAQNFHIRATTSVIEYNWFARAKSYEGDLMTDDGLSGVSAVRQTMLLRGNVIVQGAQPDNNSQVIAVYNDGQVSGLSFSLRMVNNTFVGNGGHAALVHLSNADGTVMRAELVNNIVAGTSVVTLVEDATRASVSGSNNWVVTGASAAGISASVTGSQPGFANAAAKDFTLGVGSPAIAQAAAAADVPTYEYYRDEQIARQSRTRATAKDLGAFESTTVSTPLGPYGKPIPVALDGGLDATVDAPSTGGMSGGGGMIGRGGTLGAGGATGTGGGTGAAIGAGGGTGGAIGAGGRPGTGGAIGAGGSIVTGGATGTGGTIGTPDASTVLDARDGGSSSVGDSAVGKGDAAPGTGGAVGSGGATTGSPVGKSSGCSCELGGRRADTWWWALVLGVLAAYRRFRESRDARTRLLDRR